uniref:Uncharacterized protein n=1 Tax=Arundo donax TaxID=35708 RepID=A0A0A9D5M1_ARUDO
MRCIHRPVICGGGDFGLFYPLNSLEGVA